MAGWVSCEALYLMGGAVVYTALLLRGSKFRPQGGVKMLTDPAPGVLGFGIPRPPVPPA